MDSMGKLRVIFIVLLLGSVIMHIGILDILESNFVSNSSLLCTSPEKAMATHSSTLAWKIPWMEEPSRLQSMGLLGVGHVEWLHFTFHFHTLEKEMATHSSVLAWTIPGTGEPGGLPSMRSHKSRTRLKWLSSSVSMHLPLRHEIFWLCHSSVLRNTCNSLKHLPSSYRYWREKSIKKNVCFQMISILSL